MNKREIETALELIRAVSKIKSASIARTGVTLSDSEVVGMMYGLRSLASVIQDARHTDAPRDPEKSPGDI